MGAADVAEEPEGRLGHRHQRALRRHAERPVHGEAAAPAHADPVDDCHVRLRQPPDQAVEVVLGAEERERVRRPPGAGPGDGRLDVPPRAERLPPRALDEDGVDVRVGIPLRVQLVQPPHHPRVDRVQLRNVTRGCTAASAHGPVSPRGFGVLRKAGSAPACPARPAAPLRRRESEEAREREAEGAPPAPTHLLGPVEHGAAERHEVLHQHLRPRLRRPAGLPPSAPCAPCALRLRLGPHAPRHSAPAARPQRPQRPGEAEPRQRHREEVWPHATRPAAGWGGVGGKMEVLGPVEWRRVPPHPRATPVLQSRPESPLESSFPGPDLQARAQRAAAGVAGSAGSPFSPP